MPPKTRQGSKKEVEASKKELEEEAIYGSFDNETARRISSKSQVINLLDAFRSGNPLEINLGIRGAKLGFSNIRKLNEVFNSLVKNGDLAPEEYDDWIAFFSSTPQQTPQQTPQPTPEKSKPNSAASSPGGGRQFDMEGFGIHRVYMKGFGRIKGVGIGSSRIFPSTKSDKDIIDDIRRMAKYGSPALRAEIEYHLRQSKFGFGMSSKNLMSLRDFVANQVGIEVP